MWKTIKSWFTGVKSVEEPKKINVEDKPKPVEEPKKITVEVEVFLNLTKEDYLCDALDALKIKTTYDNGEEVAKTFVLVHSSAFASIHWREYPSLEKCSCDEASQLFELKKKELLKRKLKGIDL